MSLLFDRPEKVLCAATWYKDFPKAVHGARNIDEGLVVAGWRHPNIIGIVMSLSGKRTAELDYQHGFLTTNGNFISRLDAMVMAKANNQVSDTIGHKELFSEDLY